MPQPQHQGGCETSMNVPDAQQWLTGPSPHIVLPRKPGAVSHNSRTLLDPQIHKTTGAMNSPDWNSIFKFEGDVGFTNANQFGNVASNDIFSSGHQHNVWSTAQSYLPSQPPVPRTLSNNGHTNNLSDRWSLRRDSIASQSGRAPHRNSTTHIHTNAWPLQAENASMHALQSSSAPSSETSQTNVTQHPVAAVPSIMSSSYSSTGTISFGIQTSNAAAYNKIEPASPIVAPQTLHDGSWDYFNPMNQYPNTMATQSYTPLEPSFYADFHGLPMQTGPQTPERGPNPVQDQNSFLDDAYSVSPAWVEWGQTYGTSFSSESDMELPVSPVIPADAQGNQSFSSSVDSNTVSIPPLTYSQTSPASDLEDLSSSYPGEPHAYADLKDSVQYELRNQSFPADHNNGFATHPSQPRCHTTTWNQPFQPPPAVYDDTNAVNKRVEKDDLLVQWKRAGMSYRQIRDKGGFTEAESTLRGRFRTLTKNREERVRKPLWMTKDVHLLREGVKMLMAGSLYPGTDAADMDVSEMDIDANKVPWKKVADYISENGGSYHFGNATCKKQWLKIQGKLRE